jgi:ElaA protein
MNSAKEQMPGFPELRWQWFQLAEMRAGQLYDMLAFRESVFVVEQSCIYQELDGLDKSAHHLVVTEAKKVVACLRLLPPGRNNSRVRIGRVAVIAGWRKRGIARLMMHKAVEKARKMASAGICLNAQTYLQGFYQSLGFEVCGDEYLEDGIPHVPMRLSGVGPAL